MTIWTLQDAERRFDEIVQRALDIDAQEIDVGDGRTVTVINSAELRRLQSKQPKSLVEFLLESPLRGFDIGPRD